MRIVGKVDFARGLAARRRRILMGNGSLLSRMPGEG
jgi:hypothetical protein